MNDLVKHNIINSGELQPNNTCEQMNGNFIKQLSNIEKSIENVVQMAYCKKSPHKMTRKSKNSFGMTSKSISIKKDVNQSSTLKSSLNTKRAPIVRQKLDLNDFNCVQFNDTNASSVPILVVTQLEAFSSIIKRRSKRKPKLSKTIKKNLNVCEPNVTKENIDKTCDKTQINCEFERMDIEVSNENINDLMEVINAEMPLNTLNTTVCKTPIDCSQSQSITNTMSSININTNNGETEAHNSEPQITAINGNQNLNSNTDNITDPQIICFDLKAFNQKDISSETDEKQKITNDCTQLELDKRSKIINDLFTELLTKSNETDLQLIKEKIICVKYYHEIQVKELVEKSKKELLDTKKMLWCVVCHKLANMYCCVRFYCSVDCVRIDWIDGHSKQCLTLNKNN